MKSLAVGMALLCVSVSSFAADHEVVYEHGYVVYSRACEGSRMFHYFDGSRLQRLCIGSTPEVSFDKFIRFSRMGDCDFQVQVNYATVVDGILYATDIEQGNYCANPGGSPFFN